MKFIKYYPTECADPSKCTYRLKRNCLAKRPKSLEPITFLSLPGELRNQIYTLYFAEQDIYDRKIGWSRSNCHLNNPRPTYFEIPLANRQIYKEARSIAWHEYMLQLRPHRQLYRIPLDNPRSTRKWEISPNWYDYERRPKCRNIFVLAKLQFPSIGLVISMYGDSRLKEQLHRLRPFFLDMLEAFEKHGTPQSLGVHIPRLGEQYWKLLFCAMEPLGRLQNGCDLMLLANNQEFIAAFKFYQEPRKLSFEICTHMEAKPMDPDVLSFWRF